MRNPWNGAKRWHCCWIIHKHGGERKRALRSQRNMATGCAVQCYSQWSWRDEKHANFFIFWSYHGYLAVPVASINLNTVPVMERNPPRATAHLTWIVPAEIGNNTYGLVLLNTTRVSDCYGPRYCVSFEILEVRRCHYQIPGKVS